MKFFYICSFIFIFSTPILSQINLKNGLVACYPFNGNAKDETGNGNNGTVNGATLTTDRFGKANSAYKFDGSNFITLPTDKFAFDEFSYVVWIYIASNPAYGDAYRILSIGGNCGDQDINTGNNYFAGGGGISGIGGGGYNISTPISNSGVVAGTLPTIGQWYHGVITRDKNEIKLYVNGVLVRTVSTNGTLPYYGCDGKVFANIGTRSTRNQFFIGNIDDVHIYNRAITADEVKALFESNNTSPTITITTNNSAPCGGDKITFTANGAITSAKYQWKVDGINQGTNSKTFDYTSIKKTGDYSVKITVEVTDDDPCFPQKPATTDQIFTIKDCTPLPTGVNLKNGLVACYPFNANAIDESGNGNNGTINGATLTADRFGKLNSAYNFDGNSYIEISPDKLKTPTFSYALWIKSSSIPADGIAYFLFSVGSQDGDQAVGLNNAYTNGADGFTGGGYLDVGENAFCQQGSLPNINQWYHVVVVRETNFYKTYINGILVCSTSLIIKPPFYGNGNIEATIGSRYNKGQFTQGSLDDIHLYNRAITANEVKALYDGNTTQTITITTNNSAPCGGDKVTFTANGSTITSKYQWKVDGVNQGTNSKTFDYTSIKKTGDYSVKITVDVTDDDPCFPQKPSTVDKTINIKFCSTTVPTIGNKILIPNAFSPNGDGMNDTWEIYSEVGNPDVIVEIYNRWGEIIFYSKGYSEPWNGTYKDKPVLEGTYAYVVRVDSDTVFRGTILVVR